MPVLKAAPATVVRCAWASMWASAPLVPSADTAAASAWAGWPTALESELDRRPWKRAPRAATPVARPPIRKVLLIPEAMPLRSGLTTPRAILAMAGLAMPMPRPLTTSPARRVVHDEVAETPCMRARPIDDKQKAGAERDSRWGALGQRAGGQGDDEAHHRQGQEAEPSLKR